MQTQTPHPKEKKNETERLFSSEIQRRDSRPPLFVCFAARSYLLASPAVAVVLNSKI
jgi:hypothetical protein